VLREHAGGLVEGDRRQAPGVDVGQQVVPVLEVLGPVRRAGGEAGEVVERLMVRLEVG